MAKPLTSWLVPSFLQHNGRLVVSGRCLHFSLTKFQDKFASLQQVNSPNSWKKFQICCTDIYLRRFLPNFAEVCMFLWISRDFADLPEFRGSVTTRNIRSPVNTVRVSNPQWLTCTQILVKYLPLVIIQFILTGDQRLRNNKRSRKWCHEYL